MAERAIYSIARKTYAIILIFLIFRPVTMALRMFYHSTVDLTEGILSKLKLRESKGTPVRRTVEDNWPKGPTARLVLTAIRIGRDDYLAGLSLGALVISLLVLVFLPELSLAATFLSAVIFANIFLGKASFLFSDRIRIMTRKHWFWKPPSISEFLVAFPLDYLGITLAYTNFYLFISRFSWGTFQQVSAVSHLDISESLVYSLSCMTTLPLSTAFPETTTAKLVSFSQLLSAIFFVIIFGSIIIAMFLTEKEITEEKACQADRKKLRGFLGETLYRLVGKVIPAFDECEAALHPQGSPITRAEGHSPESDRAKRTVVVRVSYPALESTSAVEIKIRADFLEEWRTVLPDSFKEKVPDLDGYMEKVVKFLDKGSTGQVLRMEYEYKDKKKAVIDVSVIA